MGFDQGGSQLGKAKINERKQKEKKMS